MASSMVTRTWHGQRPTHRPMTQDQIASKQAETMKWDAADWPIEKAHETDDDPSLYYHDYNKLVELS